MRRFYVPQMHTKFDVEFFTFLVFISMLRMTYLSTDFYIRRSCEASFYQKQSFWLENSAIFRTPAVTISTLTETRRIRNVLGFFLFILVRWIFATILHFILFVLFDDFRMTVQTANSEHGWKQILRLFLPFHVVYFCISIFHFVKWS